VHILGGGVSDPDIASRLRAHLVQLCALLFSAFSKGA